MYIEVYMCGCIYFTFGYEARSFFAAEMLVMK